MCNKNTTRNISIGHSWPTHIRWTQTGIFTTKCDREFECMSVYPGVQVPNATSILKQFHSSSTYIFGVTRDTNWRISGQTYNFPKCDLRHCYLWVYWQPKTRYILTVNGERRFSRINPNIVKSYYKWIQVHVWLRSEDKLT